LAAPGEEAQWLAERGIESEIVNASPARLAVQPCGIPLTLRGTSRG